MVALDENSAQRLALSANDPRKLDLDVLTDSLFQQADRLETHDNQDGRPLQARNPLAGPQTRLPHLHLQCLHSRRALEHGPRRPVAASFPAVPPPSPFSRPRPFNHASSYDHASSSSTPRGRPRARPGLPRPHLGFRGRLLRLGHQRAAAVDRLCRDDFHAAVERNRDQYRHRTNPRSDDAPRRSLGFAARHGADLPDQTPEVLLQALLVEQDGDRGEIRRWPAMSPRALSGRTRTCRSAPRAAGITSPRSMSISTIPCACRCRTPTPASRGSSARITSIATRSSIRPPFTCAIRSWRRGASRTSSPAPAW